MCGVGSSIVNYTVLDPVLNPLRQALMAAEESELGPSSDNTCEVASHPEDYNLVSPTDRCVTMILTVCICFSKLFGLYGVATPVKCDQGRAAILWKWDS